MRDKPGIGTTRKVEAHRVRKIDGDPIGDFIQAGAHEHALTETEHMAAQAGLPHQSFPCTAEPGHTWTELPGVPYGIRTRVAAVRE
jgi:hypothetical protein